MRSGTLRGAAFQPFSTKWGIFRSPSDTRTDTRILTGALRNDRVEIRSDGELGIANRCAALLHDAELYDVQLTD